MYIMVVAMLKKRNSITVAPTHFKLCMKIGFHDTQCTGV